MDGSDISLRDDRRPSDLHDPDELLWRQFGEAKSAEAFARTWLALQCRMIPGVTSGVLVLRSGGAADRFAPAAFWPEGRRTRPHLGEVAERALRERRALVVPVPQPHHEGAAAPPRLRYDVARPIEVDGELQGVVAVDVSPRSERDADATVRQLEWGGAWLEIARLRGDTTRAVVVRDRLQTILDLVAATFGQARFGPAALAFVTTVATRLDADRVTLGFLRRGRARAVAVSHSAKFSRSSNLVRAIEQAMDEAIDQQALVVWPQPSDWRPQVARAHAELARLVGPRHLGLKVSLAVAALVLLVLATATGDFRVASDATLEPVMRQQVSAPFVGYVAEAPARAGDVVKRGQLLATLDDRELRLSRLKWLSQQEQLTRQYHQAMAVRNAPAVGILAAQIDQAKAEVALLDYNLAHTRLTAPFDGMVVAGDLSQALAAPVERGQALFEIAPLDAYRVVLQVSERDVAYVRPAQRGTLVLTGTPGEPLPFVVETITPVSTAREGHNYFRVEARLDRRLERLRPGMEGVGKIEIDRRLYVWIWTRQVVDWVRLQLWKWLP